MVLLAPRVYTPNVISVGSSLFAGLTVVNNRHTYTHRPTDRPRYLVCGNRPHLRYACGAHWLSVGCREPGQAWSRVVHLGSAVQSDAHRSHLLEDLSRSDRRRARRQPHVQVDGTQGRVDWRVADGRRTARKRPVCYFSLPYPLSVVSSSRWTIWIISSTISVHSSKTFMPLSVFNCF